MTPRYVASAKQNTHSMFKASLLLTYFKVFVLEKHATLTARERAVLY